MSNEIYQGTSGAVAKVSGNLAAAAIPEVWRRKALLARYAKSWCYSRVLHVDEVVRQMGDIVHIRTLPSVTVNDVGSTNGSVTNQALSYTDTTLTVNKWKEATIDVVDKANAQAIVDILSDFSQQFGAAIAQQQDVDLFTLVAALTTNTVGSTTAGQEEQLSDELILGAIQLLDDLNVPEDDRSWFLPPVARKQLLRLDKFSLAYATGINAAAVQGYAKNQNMGEAGSQRKPLGELYGIPVMISSKIATSGNIRQAGLIHKECLAAATQKNFRIEKLARVRKSTPISGDVLYGVATIRDNHGVLVNLKSS